MKPIDALNDLKRVIYDLTSAMYLERFKDQFEALKSVIERETPAIVYKHKLDGVIELNDCPKCGKGIKHIESYCWNCGQKLYWENTYSSEEVYNKVTGRTCANYTLAEEDDE